MDNTKRLSLVAVGLFFVVLTSSFIQFDHFTRTWEQVQGAGGVSTDCAVIFPRETRAMPFVVLVHDAGGDVVHDGKILRQIARFGFCCLSFDYKETDDSAFDQQLTSIIEHAKNQSYVDYSSFALVGVGKGASKVISYVSSDRNPHPQLVAILGGRGSLVARAQFSTENIFGQYRGRVLWLQCEEDSGLTPTDAGKVIAHLKKQGICAELRVIRNASENLGPHILLFSQTVGEYCLQTLGGEDGWLRFKARAREDNTARGLESIPTSMFIALICLFCTYQLFHFIEYRSPRRTAVTRLYTYISIIQLGVLTYIFYCKTASSSSMSTFTMEAGRLTIKDPIENEQFKELAKYESWQKLGVMTLLDEVKMPYYNRGLVNWRVNDSIFYEFVLGYNLGSRYEATSLRKPLWQEFYPRIRKEIYISKAVEIVGSHLRECVSEVPGVNSGQSIEETWRDRVADVEGFDRIYVAALRAVGIPARIRTMGRTEFWDGRKWLVAPKNFIHVGDGQE